MVFLCVQVKNKHTLKIAKEYKLKNTSFGLVTHHITTINIVIGKRWVYQSCIAEET